MPISSSLATAKLPLSLHYLQGRHLALVFKVEALNLQCALKLKQDGICNHLHKKLGNDGECQAFYISAGPGRMWCVVGD